MTHTDRLADAYDAAADYIERNGWVQYKMAEGSIDFDNLAHFYARLDTEQPAVCAVGAAYAVTKKSAIWLPIDEFIGVLEKKINYMELAEWNDTVGRTAGEVIALFREAAHEIRMGNIGDNPREYEFEPFPATEPAVEPAAPQPAPEPEKVPV